MTRKPKQRSFEETLAELEKLVASMESGQLPLQSALESFERGVQLTRECQTSLQAARQKVQILQQGSAGPILADFSVPGDEGAEAEE